MSVTDELRRLLDERGVEWHHTSGSGSLGIPYTWWYSPTMGEVDATEGADGKLYMVLNLDLTPEQAVEATLGRGTCRRQPHIDLTIGDDFLKQSGWDCSECGYSLDFPVNYCSNCGRKVVDA